MKTTILGALALLGVVFVAAAQSQPWREGTNYFPVVPAQPVSAPAGEIEVTEVFSYACPACDRFYPVMDRLQKALPANAFVDYVAAGLLPSEDWLVFQRAYYTAKALGIAAKTHDAMFDAVWKTGQLQTVDPQTGRLQRPLPSIADVAQWYQERTGISAQMFLVAAHSFGVDLQVRQADAYLKACQVFDTPTIIVNGRYRVNPSSAGGYDQMVEMVKWLVAKQSKR